MNERSPGLGPQKLQQHQASEEASSNPRARCRAKSHRENRFCYTLLHRYSRAYYSLSMAATFTLLPSSYGTERYCPPASLVLPSYRPRLPRPRCRLLVPPKLSCTLLPTSQETSVATAVETARH